MRKWEVINDVSGEARFFPTEHQCIAFAKRHGWGRFSLVRPSSGGSKLRSRGPAKLARRGGHKHGPGKRKCRVCGV